MTDPAGTESPVETAEDAPGQPDDTETTGDDSEHDTEQVEHDGADRDPDDGRIGHEAARYRRRLRETESERDELSAQLGNLRRTHIEAVIARGVDIGDNRVTLSVPGDLVALGGVEVADLFAADGTVNTDRLDTALRELHASRPGLFRSVDRGTPPHASRPREDLKSGSGATDVAGPGDGPTWSGVLKSAVSAR